MTIHPRQWATGVALCVALGGAVGAAGALAAEPDDGKPTEQPPPSSEARRSWDAAIGAVLVTGPDFAGSDNRSTRLNPGFFLRWGRLSIATRGGFRTASEPTERGGFRIDLSPSERFRINLGLRYDAGRQESSSEALRGLGNVPSTLRVRVSASYKLEDGWRLGSTTIFDALGRGGGWQTDIGVSREMRATPDTTWGYAVGLGYAGDRNLQTYFGITEEQSARTGYPVYTPAAGLRDISASVNARTDLHDWFGPHWHMFYGVNASRLLGPAADSPLTRQRNALGANVGLAYRF